MAYYIDRKELLEFIERHNNKVPFDNLIEYLINKNVCHPLNKITWYHRINKLLKSKLIIETNIPKKNLKGVVYCTAEYGAGEELLKLKEVK